MKNIFLLLTNKPSKLFYNVGGALLFRNYKNHNGVNIYITSDEEIKEGDYCISNFNIIDDKKIHDIGTIFHPKTKDDLIKLKSCNKIILTTDQDLINDGIQAIDDEFLEWFIKNPSCENVDVKKDVIKHIAWDKELESKYDFEKGYPVTGYKIIIPKEEPKFENSIENSIGIISIANSMFGKKEGTLNLKNLEEKLDTAKEAAENHINDNLDLYESLIDGHISYNISIDLLNNLFIAGAKWQSERMFSEEDCYNILHNLMTDIKLQGVTINDDIDLKKWFKQFKKK